MSADGSSEVVAQILVIDYVFAGVFLLSFLYGLFRGFVREVLALVSWGLAVAAAYYFGPQAADYLGAQFQLGSFRLAAGYGAVFLGVIVAGGIAAFLIARMVNAAGLGGTDRLLGLLFGAARGLVIILVVILLGQSTVLRDESWWRDSLSLRKLGPLAGQFAEYIPQEWRPQPAGAPASAPQPALPSSPVSESSASGA